MPKGTNLSNDKYPKATIPIREGETFGNFWKISERTDLFGLNLAEPRLRGATVEDVGRRTSTKGSLSATRHIGLCKYYLTSLPSFSMLFNKAVGTTFMTEASIPITVMRAFVDK
jgi:hypothetical protein